ncbi:MULTISPECIES: cupin domain-containing protein [unclassified Micromonospora]|uniref:cupin domain-containing protein n=1 Tax=unclassified Micromonospora TaxID=2617518 RepID=UPI0033B4A733
MKSTSLPTLAEEQLTLAREAHSGRSAHTIHGGHDQALRHTVLALLAGRELAEHSSPGEATLLVLRGHVRLTTSTEAWEGRDGDHVAIPPQRHALTAVEDSVVLLTVVSPR